MKPYFSVAILATLFIHSAAQADHPASVERQAGNADSHAPIGVMGDHMHRKGEWMFSYRYMYMHMDGNRDGDSRVSPNEIVTRERNPFFGQPGQPPTLRVVPTKMEMEMHMVGAMYAPQDWLTLMLMGSWQRKEMDHLTYMGAAGTTVRGKFTTVSEGFGDTRATGMFRLLDDGAQHAHLTLGLSAPTGSIHKKGTILAPTGATPRVRLPYPMQLGSGTWDLIGGLTYTSGRQRWGWGAQYQALMRTGHNEEGYRLGDEHQATSWLSYRFHPTFSSAVRLSATDRGRIDGIDDDIVLPVQTADPDRQGGKWVNLGLSFNFAPKMGRTSGWRLAGELSQPVYRYLNGPQLETDWTMILGLQKAY